MRNANGHLMSQTLSKNVTVFRIICTHKLATAIGVLTPPVGVTSKIYGRAKINAYAAVTSMPSVRDTIQGRLDDKWYTSIRMPGVAKMYSKST